jgi:hypothetical protein
MSYPPLKLLVIMTGQNGRLQLILRLEGLREPIAGVLQDDRGAQRDFAGWMELISAIEDARQQEACAVDSAAPAASVTEPASDQ